MSTSTIPPEILSQHVAVLGKTGSGKTSTAKLAIEQVVAEGARVCVLDPIKSDWWGLTSSADGRRAGLPFHILGGPHGHVPLHSAAGKAIADVVANGALPLSIIDMADFEPGGQAKFFKDFAPTLLRKMRGIVYLVIEEAHIFAPKERSGWSDENLSIHWAKTLATAGRSKGVRLVLVTQRTQALHNALLGSCDTLIAHRLTAPADQEPVVKWLKANTSKEVLEVVSASLASQKTGEGWICSGEAKIFDRYLFPRIKTYDNTATPTGDGEAREIKTAPVDPEKLRAIIGDAVEKAKAEDPRELRKQITELKRQLQGAAQVHPKMDPIRQAKTVEKFVLKDGQLARLEKLYEKLFNEAARHATALELFWTNQIDEAKAILNVLAMVAGEQTPFVPAEVLPFQNTQATTQRVERHRQAPVMPTPGRGAVPAATASRPAPRVSPSDNGSLGKADRAILTVLAQHPEGCERGKLTLLAGYSWTGTFRTYLSALRTAGYIVGDNGGTMAITDAGRQALGDFDPLPSGRELAEYWINHPRFNSTERDILRALVERGHTADELCAAIGKEWSGTLRTYLSNLRTAGVIVGRNNETMRASPELIGG